MSCRWRSPLFVIFFSSTVLVILLPGCTSFPVEEEIRVPLVIGLSPTEGVLLTPVSINGANFSISGEKNKVFFNGQEAKVLESTPTQLKVLVPPRAGSGTVKVMVDDSPAINQPNFTYKFSVSNLTGGENIWHQDGSVDEAQFEGINGMVVDNEGNLFVIDGHYIRKISAAGQVTTIAGNGDFGFSDGVGEDASFAQPSGIAIDDDGNLYVADTYNHAVRKITQDGIVTTIAGLGYAGYEDGDDALFAYPEGIAVAGPNAIYVADSGNNRIRLVESNGFTITLAGSGEPYQEGAGYKDGMAYHAILNSPSQLVLGKEGELYFTEPNQNLIRRLQFDEVTTVAGAPDAGHVDGAGTQARFAFPIGIAIDRDFNLFVADAGSNYLRKITPGGVVSTFGGNGETEDSFGKLETSGLGMPRHLAISDEGTMYLSVYLPRIMIIQ
jgi:serine/threonine protein kinase, bacterial